MDVLQRTNEGVDDAGRVLACNVGQHHRARLPNPIAMAFAKLKALLRQNPARTVGLVKAIGRLLDRCTPEQMRHVFTAEGNQLSR